MFERLPFGCAMFDGEDDIPEYKVNDETLPAAPCLMVKMIYLNIK